jgi:DNA-binding CsgD family transcriptional regulator
MVTERKDPCELAPRELEAFRLVGEGLSNAEIAERMGIRVTTARTYMKRLHDKLYVKNRSRLVIESYRYFAKEVQHGVQ